MIGYVSKKDVDVLLKKINDCSDMVFEDENLCARIRADCGSCRWKEVVGAIRHMIDKMPSEDVQPVVRCKDCCIGYRSIFDGRIYCDFMDTMLKPDEFCSHGRR